jgi:putative DNA primase/helicase
MAAPDFRGVASAALRVAQDLVPRWLPGGRAEGNEWVAANPRRASSDGGGAFRINLHSGAWADFAGTDKGGDLISLWAYLHGLEQWPACRAVAEQLGIDPGGSSPAGAGPRTTDESTRARQIERDRSARSALDGTSVSPAPADAPPVEAALHHFRLGQPTRHWLYRDAAGLVLMAVARWNLPTEKDPRAKEIMPLSLWRLPTGALAWRWKGLPKPWPLYRIDELARRPEATVVVCEGEKATDAAQQLLPEYVATTSPSGSKNARQADWSPLAGRRVLIWPDHDAPGLGYADGVRAGLLDAGAASIQVLSFAWVAKALAAARRGSAA